MVLSKRNNIFIDKRWYTDGAALPCALLLLLEEDRRTGGRERENGRCACKPCIIISGWEHNFGTATVKKGGMLDELVIICFFSFCCCCNLKNGERKKEGKGGDVQ